MSNNTINIEAGGGSLIMTSSAIGSENKIIVLGNVLATVKQTISQLPNSSEPKEIGIKEVLLQLQKVIEENTELSPEDKIDLLEQVQAFAEASQTSKKEEKEGIVRKAKKIFDATLKGLPDTAKIVDACGKLLPIIMKILGLNM